MGLRLILVGVVAGLGLTLPTGKQFEAWKVSAQTWMNARLAEWDEPMPADESAFVLIAEPTATAADASQPPLASETPAPEIRTESAHAETAAPEIPAASQPAVPTDLALGLDLPTAPMPIEETDPKPAPAGPSTTLGLDGAFDVAQHAVLSDFRRHQPATVATSNSEGPTATGTAARSPRFGPVELDENLYAGVAYALNHGADGLTVPPTDARPSRGFEPLEVGNDLYTGVAYELNRKAEGLDPSTAPETTRLTLAQVGETKSLESADRLTHAVRLTREAMNAWANLLHGPAVVLITH